MLLGINYSILVVFGLPKKRASLIIADANRIIELAKIFNIEPAELLLEEGKVINHGQSYGGYGYINNFYYSDLKETHEKHIESLKKEIERLNEEVIFLRTQLAKG